LPTVVREWLTWVGEWRCVVIVMLLAALKDAGTDEEWQVFVTGGRPSLVWRHNRSQRERLTHLWFEHTLRPVTSDE